MTLDLAAVVTLRLPIPHLSGNVSVAYSAVDYRAVYIGLLLTATSMRLLYYSAGWCYWDCG